MSKNSSIAIYPYIEGLSNISFEEQDKADYYIPNSVGSDFTEQIAMDQLRRNNVVEQGNIRQESILTSWIVLRE